MNNTAPKRKRLHKTKTIVQQLAGQSIVNVLPDKDKVEIMNWLLQMPLNDIKKLVSNPSTPAFVVKCAEMLHSEPLERYFELMHRCRMRVE